MSEAVSLTGMSIKCDNEDCDFEQEIEVDDFLSWHNRECPKCSTILVDDADLNLFNGIAEAMKTVNDLVGDIPAGHRANMRIDLAEFK